VNRRYDDQEAETVGYAQEYAPAIMSRGRVPMEPVDFVPDWGDAPRKGKFYPGVDAIPLPTNGLAGTGDVQSGLGPPVDPGGRGFTVPLLSGLLLDSYALLGRRLGVQANTDMAALPTYAHGNWFRGTASGGGLYPCSIYWVCGPGGPLTPGVYYYSHPRHAMQPLLAGDVSAEVRAALGHLPAAARTDQFLIIGIKYWQNAFKYNSFSYHAVTMDVGTLLQTWQIWARSQGLFLEPALWFDQAPLTRLLGVSDADEGVFAVVPLTWDGGGIGRSVAPAADGNDPPHVHHADRERSRNVVAFDSVRRMSAATVGHAAGRPAPQDLRPAAAIPAAEVDPLVGVLALPDPQRLTMDVRTALRRRRSSFGRFEAHRPLAAAQLSALLAASAGTRVDCDVTAPERLPLAKLYVFVNHVRDVPAGSYEYDGATNTLRPIRPGPPGDFLDRNYFLANYNLEQAAAVLVPTVRTSAVLEALGDRGYHLVNATVGAIAQTCYTAAAALGVGCGVALGFDNISYVEELGLGPTGESPLLIMLVGHERREPADFRYELV
jgi:SagB-type dehydrogenase family enzyme